MKLKYYLRGIGMGIIFATIVMAVSSVIHNNNLSNEFIIKEAQKLGMVMPETEDKGGLWGSESSEDVSGTENLDENISGTETVTGTENSDTDEISDVDESFDATEHLDENDVSNNTDVSLEEPVYHTITITDYDAARHVGEKLQEKGLVSNGEEFRIYVRDQGYAYRIRTGTFQIPEGATFEEICDIIVR